jgi:hypothetical protein
MTGIQERPETGVSGRSQDQARRIVEALRLKGKFGTTRSADSQMTLSKRGQSSHQSSVAMSGSRLAEWTDFWSFIQGEPHAS